MRMWNLVKGRLGFVRKLKEQAFKVLFSPDGAEYEYKFPSYSVDMLFCTARRAASIKWQMVKCCMSCPVASVSTTW